jgi:cytochrome c553
MHFSEILPGRYRPVLALLCGLTVVPALGADPASPPATRAQLASLLQTVERDSPRWQTLMAEGRARTDFCARCHGPDGVSVMPLVPNLAGQNPYYLLEQSERFADGRRQDYIMSPLARQLSPADRIALVFYYAGMPAQAKAADPALVGQGAQLYGQRCIACHGPGAHGSDQYARLAGQNPAYLKRRLAGFREARGGAISVMSEIAKTLGEPDIERVTAYLSSLP